MKNMKKIIEELDAAVANLEALSMSGKAVDIMAAAKVHIYEAQAIANGYVKEADVKAKQRAEKNAQVETARLAACEAATEAVQKATDYAETALNAAKEAECYG